MPTLKILRVMKGTSWLMMMMMKTPLGPLPLRQHHPLPLLHQGGSVANRARSNYCRRWKSWTEILQLQRGRYQHCRRDRLGLLGIHRYMKIVCLFPQAELEGSAHSTPSTSTPSTLHPSPLPISSTDDEDVAEEDGGSSPPTPLDDKLGSPKLSLLDSLYLENKVCVNSHRLVTDCC